MLKQLDRFIVEDVTKVSLEKTTLDTISAQSINFTNVKFTQQSQLKFKDHFVRSSLEFNHCVLPDVTVDLHPPSREGESELSVIFNNCELDKLDFKIVAAKVEIKNNRFHRPPGQFTFDVNVVDSFSFNGNMLLPHKTSFPDIEINEKDAGSNPFLVSFSLDELNATTIRTWLDILLELENSETESEQKMECYGRDNGQRRFVITCPNEVSLKNYLRTPKFNQLPFRETKKPHNSEFVADTANALNPILTVPILIAITALTSSSL